MRACILAAGIGQRLRPLTDDRPKALVEIDGRTFLDRLIAQLVAVGVRDLVIATGWRSEAIARAVEGAPIEVTLCFNEAFDHTQNSVSLHACRHALLAGGAVDTLKLDGDVIIDVEVLRRLIDARRDDRAPIVAAIDERSTTTAQPLGAEEMKVELVGERAWGSATARSISRFGKGLDPRRCAGESIGVELLGAEGIGEILARIDREICAGERDLYYEDVYDRWIMEGGTARGVRVGDLPWTEVDTLEDLSRAGRIAAQTRLA